MSASPSMGRRLVAFRLADLPPSLLERGKNTAIKRESDPFKRLEIGRAAENPSQRVYWISVGAWETAMKSGRRR